jgi:hypothetical protein
MSVHKADPIERDLKGTVFAPLRLWEKGPGDEGKPHRYEIHPSIAWIDNFPVRKHNVL